MFVKQKVKLHVKKASPETKIAFPIASNGLAPFENDRAGDLGSLR